MAPLQANTDSNARTVTLNADQVVSGELLGNRKQIVIQHAGASYHLRETRSGKLILTK